MSDELSSRQSTPKKVPVIVGLILAIGIIVVGYMAVVAGQDPSRTGPNGERIFDVELVADGEDLGVSPSKISVDPGDHVVVEVTNGTEGQHDLKLDGNLGTEMLSPGQVGTADFGVIQSSTQAWCTVPGHREAGMVLDIEVTGTPEV
jgi:uncharacterized cupredoxin-like copper-binding protein